MGWLVLRVRDQPAMLVVDTKEGSQDVDFSMYLSRFPKGQRNKYEVDHETGRIRLDRMLFTGDDVPRRLTGFIEDTLGARRRPPRRAHLARSSPRFLDVRSVYMVCALSALFEMTEENGPDAKVICVPAGDPR